MRHSLPSVGYALCHRKDAGLIAAAQDGLSDGGSSDGGDGGCGGSAGGEDAPAGAGDEGATGAGHGGGGTGSATSGAFGQRHGLDKGGGPTASRMKWAKTFQLLDQYPVCVDQPTSMPTERYPDASASRCPWRFVGVCSRSGLSLLFRHTFPF